MPIKLEIVQEKGWRKLDPSDPLFCIYFRDENTEKVLFKYAPKWEDIPRWLEIIKAMVEYENWKSQKGKEKKTTNRLSTEASKEKQTKNNATDTQIPLGANGDY